MTRLQMVDTTDNPQTAPADTLEGYWRRKFDQLTEDTTAQTIRSLRSQLRAIRRLATEEPADPDTLAAIATHAAVGLGLEIST